MVLEAFGNEKHDSECPCCTQAPERQAAHATFSRARSDGHCEAAGHQHAGVECAEENFSFACRGDKAVRIKIAIDGVGEEQPTEEQHLASEKSPHAEGDGFFLACERRPRFMQSAGNLAHDPLPSCVSYS